MSYLPAILIELLIQCSLIGLREMTMVFPAHIVFLLVDGPEITPVLMGLRTRDLAFLTFRVDAVFLAVHAPVHLVNPGMALYMGRLMTGTLGKGSAGDK